MNGAVFFKAATPPEMIAVTAFELLTSVDNELLLVSYVASCKMHFHLATGLYRT
jgi:hypothetical protein